MHIEIRINDELKIFEVAAGELLIWVLRRAGYFSIKHGCETGDCGACAVLVEGRPVPSCMMLAAQADGRRITTAESLGTPDALHPVQQAFVDVGAIQCGYCTPAMILVAKALLDQNPQPTELDARQALSGVLCRCTGYVKPIQAILQIGNTRPGA
ncbi:MAG: (2Fe-2S)-binding protein [Acidobacteria bacterium]|nr:(2Fe-2S)-binding protein [Acidobacteriota bacterium]